jgi:hypothetical protein
MSYQLNIALPFGETGLALHGKLYNAGGTQIGDTVTSGFVELGGGNYSYLADVPYGFYGAFVAYDQDDPSLNVIASINPQETQPGYARAAGESDYKLVITIAIGIASLPLNGKLFDADGEQTGNTITSGFVELGYGNYLYLATLDNGYVGSLLIYSAVDASINAIVSINPAEAEPRLKTPTSRGTSSGGGGTIAAVTPTLATATQPKATAGFDLSDYTDRVIDVLAFRGVVATGDAQLDASLVDQESTGEICTGIQKLAQRFALELLTERGSIAYAADRGTDLMATLLSGKARTTADVQAVFALSELQARINLAAEEADTDPADERYGQTKLQSTVLEPGRLVLVTRLESLAGEDAKIILPIPLVV